MRCNNLLRRQLGCVAFEKRRLEILIDARLESRGADTKEDQVYCPGVGDSLRNIRRNQNHVVCPHRAGILAANLHATFALEDEVALCDSAQHMQLGFHARLHPGPGN